MIPHHFTVCRPALVALDGMDPVETEAISAAVQRVWATINDPGRRLYHEFTCLEVRSPIHLAFLSVFHKRVRDQVIADQERHRRNAAGVLDMIEKVGVVVKDPEPGQEVTVAVNRVADSMALGDDPPPYIAVRRQIVHCSRCGENCFSDPVTYGQGSPTFVCMRCLDPKVSEALDIAVANAQAASDG